MTNSTPEPRRLDDPATTTGLMSEARVLEELESRMPESPQAPAYVKEPLFSKKVMAGWAAAAFVVWMFFSFIAPVIKDSIRSSIVNSIEPPGTNTAVRTVITNRNGVTVTVTEKGISVDRPASGQTPPAPAAPTAAPPVPDPAPAAGAPVPEAKKAAGETSPRR